METPLRIFFVGNSPQGGKLRVHFQGKDLPSSIQIKGTKDNQPVKLRKNNKNLVSAMWSSKSKYTSRQITLQFISCGKVVSECKYDSCGDVIIDNPSATIDAKKSSITAIGGTVTLAWTSVVEDAVDQYCAEKRPQGSTADWDSFEADEPEGAGSSYAAVDQVAASANLDYRLRAIYTDGTDAVLMEKVLNITVAESPAAEISGFTAVFNVDTGYTVLDWTVIKEVSVLRYNIMRKDPGASDYNLCFSVVPVGPGKQEFQNQTDDSGDYSYEIIPVYVGEVVGKVLATAGSTVPAVA